MPISRIIVDQNIEEILKSAKILRRVHNTAGAVQQDEQANGDQQHNGITADPDLFGIVRFQLTHIMPPPLP